VIGRNLEPYSLLINPKIEQLYLPKTVLMWTIIGNYVDKSAEFLKDFIFFLRFRERRNAGLKGVSGKSLFDWRKGII
jgi:hypothetical protein